MCEAFGDITSYSISTSRSGGSRSVPRFHETDEYVMIDVCSVLERGAEGMLDHGHGGAQAIGRELAVC